MSKERDHLLRIPEDRAKVALEVPVDWLDLFDKVAIRMKLSRENLLLQVIGLSVDTFSKTLGGIDPLEPASPVPPSESEREGEGDYTEIRIRVPNAQLEPIEEVAALRGCPPADLVANAIYVASLAYSDWLRDHPEERTTRH